jgi:LysR family glycine cleavage system transcriptional activator
MTSNLPHLSWLRAFEAAARTQSFTHAAMELNLTQAAVSKQIKLLEHQLREPLFERKARSVVLTKAGADYLPKVQDSFARLAAGTQEVFGRRRAGPLTVRAPAGFSVNWIAPRLPRFLDAHPGIRMRLVSSIWSEDFEKARFDLDIRYGLGRWTHFSSHQLTREVLEPVCAPALAARLHAPRDLASERLLHVMGYQEGWASWFRLAGAPEMDAGEGVHFDTSLLAFEVAAQGAGVALGRRSMTAKEIAAGRLVAPFDIVAPIDEAFHLLSSLDGPEHPDAEAFRAWIIAEAQIDQVNAARPAPAVPVLAFDHAARPLPHPAA